MANSIASLLAVMVVCGANGSQGFAEQPQAQLLSPECLPVAQRDRDR